MAHPIADSTYLQLTADLMRSAKERSHERMRIGPGSRVLDVGCGPGTDTLVLAGRVGEAGSVEGVDFDPEMVAEAERRAAAAGVAERTRHRQGDAASLPFGDGAFDATRSERLFQHLREPERALAEMVRVTRPGGWVVVLDTDWGTRVVDTPEVEAERRLARVLPERILANGYSGRRLFGMFRRAGLDELSVEVFPVAVHSYPTWRYLSKMEETEQEAVEAGILTEEEVRRLHESLEAAEAEGAFFGMSSLIMVAGRKPLREASGNG